MEENSRLSEDIKKAPVHRKLLMANLVFDKKEKNIVNTESILPKRTIQRLYQPVVYILQMLLWLSGVYAAHRSRAIDTFF